MIRRTHMFVMFLILTAIATTTCLGADKISADGWPGWRGANRDGKSSDTGLLKSWPEGGPKRLWSLSGIGSGYSSASAGGGWTCLDLKTGKKQWYEGGVGKGSVKGRGPSWAHPVVTGGK